MLITLCVQISYKIHSFQISFLHGKNNKYFVC